MKFRYLLVVAWSTLWCASYAIESQPNSDQSHVQNALDEVTVVADADAEQSHRFTAPCLITPGKLQVGGSIIFSSFGAGVVQSTSSGGLFSNNGTNGQLLIGGGSAPAWANLSSSDGSVNITNSPNSINLQVVGGGGGIVKLDADDGNHASGASVTVTGGGIGSNIVTSANNGSTFTIKLTGTTQHALQVGNSSGGLTSLPTGATGQLLYSEGSGSNPNWTTSTFPVTGNVTGDIMYGSAADAFALLPFNNTATRYLANTGSSNTTPQWDQVNLTNGVTGVLPITNGGTNTNAFSTTDGTVYFDGTKLATTGTGTATQVLTSNGPGVAPSYQPVSSSGAVTSVNAGTNISITGTATAPVVNVVTAPTFTGLVTADGGLTVSGATQITGTTTINTSGSSTTTIGSGTSATTVAGSTTLSSLGQGVLSTSNTGLVSSTATTNHAVQIGNLNGNLTSLAVGTNGQVLLGSTGADPVFATLGSSTLTYTLGAGSLSIDITAPVNIAHGGTNATSFSTTDGTVYFDGTKLATTGTGTATQVLTSNGPGVAPSYQPVSSSGAVTSVNAGTNISITGTATAPVVNVINSPTFSGSVVVGTGLTVSGGEAINTGTLTLPAGSITAPSLIFSGSQTNTGITAQTADTLSFDVKGTEIFNVSTAGITVDAFNTAAGLVHNSASGLLFSSLLTTADLGTSGMLQIPNSNLVTLTQSGLVQNSATTATSANTANTIVLRDGSGNFSAGTITANLVGTVTGHASLDVLKAGDTMTGTLTLPAGNATTPSLQFTGSTNTGLSAQTANTLSLDVNGNEIMKLNASGVTIDAFNTAGVVHNSSAGLLTSSLIVDADITAGTITNDKLATISSMNGSGTIVVRDASGNFATNMITLDGTVTNATDAATKAYVDTAVSLGLTVHTPAVVYASSNFTSCCPPSGPATIDGYTVQTGDRVLLNGQIDQIFNGVWNANTAGNWTYPADFSSGSLIGKAYVLITGGNTYKGSSWVCNTPTATIGTNSINFVEFALPNNVTGTNVGSGSGLVYQSTSGQTLNFRTLLQGSYMTITTGTNEVTIATNGTSSNIANNLVARDGAGNFAAGTITAATGLNVTTGGATIDGNALLQSQSALRLQDASATQNFVGIQAPATVTTSYTVSLPASAPTAGQVLQATSPSATEWSTIGGLPTTAQTYYVSKSGSDSNNGSFAAPFLTIAHAITVAHTSATPPSLTNPVIIYVGAGTYVENAITISDNGISLVGSSMASTVIVPSNSIIAGNLITVNVPTVNFYNLTLDSQQSSPASINGIGYSVSYSGTPVLSNEVQAGFHSLSINGFQVGLQCINSGSSQVSLIIDALQTQGNFDAITINNTILATVENCIFTGPYTGSTPANTAIAITGSNTLVTLLNNLYRYLTTGININSGANARILGSNFEGTTTSIVSSSASVISIVGCDFINNNSGAVNIGLSGTSTDAHIVGCTFQCAPDGSSAVGTAIQVTTGATITIDSCVIANAVLGLQAGQTGDTSSTSLQAASVMLSGCTQDIQQNGLSTLHFIGGTFDTSSGKVVINNSTNVMFAAFDATHNNALALGNNTDTQQPMFEVYNGESTLPTLNYEPTYFGNKGLVYLNSNAGDSVVAGVQSSSNNAYNYVVTGSRTNQAGIDLISNTGSFGATGSVRGWSITKLGTTDAPLAFNFSNNDLTGLATIPSYTLMQLDGATSQVSVTASGNSTVPALSVTASPTGSSGSAGASITSNSVAPALILAGQSTTTAAPLRMTGMPAAASNNFILAIDNSGNVTQTTITDTILGNIIVNGGQTGPLTIGTTNATSLAFETNGNAALSINNTGNVTLTPQSGTALTIASGGASITGTTSINTSGTAATTIGNSTGNTTIDGNLTITPTGTNQTALSVTGNGIGTAVTIDTHLSAGAAARIIGNANSPALIVVGNGTTTGPALRMIGVPAAASNNFILAIDTSGNVTQTTITDTTLGNIIVNGGQPGPLTIGTTNATSFAIETNSLPALLVDAHGGVTINTPTIAEPSLTIPPTGLTQTSSVLIGHQSFGMYVQGRYAYVANLNGGTSQFQIIDVSTPSNIFGVSAVSTQGNGNPADVYVQGNYAYLVNQIGVTPGALQIFDVSNPTAPTLVSTSASTGTFPNAIYVQGKYAYIVTSGNTNTFQIFDISNPQTPTAVGSLNIAGGLFDIYVQGKYAYVVNEANSPGGLLQIIDVSNPGAPVIVNGAGTSTGSQPIGVYVQGRYAYVVNFATTGSDNQGVQIFDISNPAAPTLAGQTNTALTPAGIYVQGNYAYVINETLSGLSGVQIINVSNPNAPFVIPTTAPNAVYTDLFVQGRYLYTISGTSNSGGFFAYDLGGSYIQQLEAGGIEVGTLQTRENMTVNNDLAVVGGATFARGFEATGPCAITASGSYAGVSPTASGWQPALEVAGQLFVPPMAPPAAVGSLSTNISTARDVYVQGRYAYVASFGNNKLVVFDVSNPSTPFFVSSIGTLSEPISVYVQGRYAYVALFNSANLQIFDISNPFVPTLVSTTPTVGIGSFFVYVQGKYAYVINGNQNKLQIFDVSNPAVPISVSVTTTAGVDPNGLYVQGNYAYITDGTSNKLEIFDVSNPVAPVSMNGSSTGTGSGPYGIYVQGRYVYLVNTGSGGTTGLQIFDISNPASPLLVSSTPTGTTPFDVYVQGRYAYVVNEGSSTLQIFDVSNPAAPVSMGLVTTNANPSSLFVQGRYVYVATQGGALQIFDLGGAYIQQLEAGGIEVGTLQTRENMTVNNDLAVVGGATFARGFEATGPCAITASGSYAGASFTASGWQPALNVSGQLFVPPMAPPSAVGQTTTGTNPFSVYVQGRYAYVVNNGSSTLQIFDVSNPAAIFLVSTVNAGTNGSANGGPKDVYVQGQYAYVLNASTQTLQVFDISDPFAPVSISSSVSIGGAPQGMYVQGKYVYIVNNGALRIFDVSNPASPQQVGSNTSVGNAGVVYVQGKYAYLSIFNSSTGLVIVDVSNPTAPTIVGSVGTGATTLGIFVQGRYAYLCNYGNATLQIIDISNPASPTIVNGSGIPTGANNPQGIFVQGRYAYVVNVGSTGVNGLGIFDVSNPTTTAGAIGSITTGNQPISVFIQGRYAYVVNFSSNTLQAFDLGGAYIQQLEAGGIEVGTLQTRENMTVNNDLAVVGGATFGRGFEATGPSAITVSGSFLASGSVPALILTGNSNAASSTPLRLSGVPAAASNNFILAIDTSGNVTQTTITDTTLGNIIVNGGQAGPLNIGTTNASVMTFEANNIVGMTVSAGNIGIGSEPTGLAPYTQLVVPGSLPPSAVGVISTTSTVPQGLYVQGRYAYVVNAGSTGTNGLQIFDVSNPQTPLLIGSATTGTNPFEVYVQGRYAYVTNSGSNSLQIFDVSNPAAPTLVNTSGTTTGTSPNGVYVQGKYAYVTNAGSSSLQIFDVSNPAAPSLISTTTTSGTPIGIYVQGKYVYVIGNTSSVLQIFDANNPAAPVPISTFTVTSGGVRYVYVQGRYAYVGDNIRFQIVDISNPASPSSAGIFATGLSAACGVYVQGRYAYVVSSGNNTVVIVDVSTPSNPLLVGTITTAALNNNSHVFVQGRYLYVTAGGANELQIFDLGGAYIQQLEAGGIEVGTLQTRENMTVNNDLAVVGGATFGRGFESNGPSAVTASGSYTTNGWQPALEVAGQLFVPPMAPSSAVGSVTTGNAPTSVYVQGRYAYVLNGTSNTLQIIDVSNPSTPVVMNGTPGTATTFTTPFVVYVQGRYAYITYNSGGLEIFDVSDPVAPVSVGTIATTGAQGMYVQGKYAYIAHSASLQIVDISNPQAPVQAGSIATASGLVEIYVQGRYAYAINTTTKTLLIFDVSNPAFPSLVGSTATLGINPRGIYVQGRYAYIANEGTTSSLQIYDISNPASPTPVTGGSLNIANGLFGIYGQGRYVYGTSDNNTVQIIDVSIPSAPVVVGSTPVAGPTQPFRLFVQGRYVYVVNNGSTGSNGLQILDVGGAYIQQLEAGGIEVGTLQTRENMTVNNDLAVVGGATFGRGFESTGPSAITASGSYTSNGWIPALEVAGQLFVPPMAPPSAVGSATTGGGVGGNTAEVVFVQGRYVYVVNSGTTNSFQIFDASNPSSPNLIGQLAIGASVFGLFVEGRYAYIVTSTGTVQIIDVSNPQAPVVVGQLLSTNADGDIYVQGKYLYLTGGGLSNKLLIIDVSNPITPTLVGSVSTIGSQPGNIYVQGKFAYITTTGGNTFEIYDVSNPVAPVLVNTGGTSTSTQPEGVYVQGRYAYVCIELGGTLNIYDISNPASPTLIASIAATAPFDPLNVYVQGRYAYVTNASLSNSEIVVIDVSTPSAPTIVGTIPTGSGPGDIYVQGRYLYVINTNVSAGVNGLQIFDVGGAYIQQLEAGGIEVGTLATRENMTVNNDLAVVGGATFARGFEATGPCAITASGSYAGASFTASGWQPALEVAGQLFVPPMAPPSAVNGTGTATGTNPYGMYVQGKYVYVTNKTNNTLQIFDVSNPASPVAVNGTSGTSTGTGPVPVYVQGRYAYVTNETSNTLQIFDVSNPASPVAVNGTPGTSTGTAPYDVYVQGRYAYVTNETSNTLQIFDVSNPALPVAVNGTPGTSTGTTPVSVYVQGKYAYVTNFGSNTLQIFDVSNPTSPVAVNGTPGTSTGTGPASVYVQGKYAYVTNETNNTLQIFDVSNPASPVVVNGTPGTSTGNTPISVYVQGRYAYIVNFGSNTLQIFDVSNPASPVPLGTVGTGSGSGPDVIYIQGRYAYVVNQLTSNLQIFDLGGAYIQQLEAGGIEVGTLQTRENMTVNNDLAVVGGATFARGFEATGPCAITASGSYAGVSPIASGWQPALEVAGQLFVPPMAPPAAIGSATTGGGVGGNTAEVVFVQGRYVYVANSGTTNSFQIFDASNPASPALIGGLPIGTNVLGLYVQGRYAYIVTGAGVLQIIDVSDPVAPVVVGQLSGLGDGALYVQGKYAYLAGGGLGNKVSIIDVSNPLIPTFVSSVATTGSQPQNMYVQGRYAYVTTFGGHTFEIFDLSNPAAPVQVSSTNIGTTLQGVYVQGRYAYVSVEGTNRVNIYDVSNPASPSLTGTVTISNISVGLYAQGRYLYVANGTNGVVVVDVSNPSAPTVLSTITTASGPAELYAQGRYLYVINQGVTAGAQGLQIFDLGGAYIQQLEAGGIEVGTLQTRENMTVNNDLAVVGGATFARGFQSTGPSSITASGSYASSSTASGWQPALEVAGQLYVPPIAPPGQISFTSLGAQGNSIYVQGRYAYIGIGNATQMTIYDVSNPQSPALIGSASGGISGVPSSIYVQGRYAYMACGNANVLLVFDVSNPASPVVVNGVGTSTATGAQSVYVQGKYAYVVNYNNGGASQLQIFDVSNPASPSLVNTGGTSTGNGAYSVYVQGKYAYVVNYNGGGASQLQIFDVSNPVSPSLVNTGGTSTGNGAFSVYVQGRYAYVVNASANSLQIFDVSNPASPSLVNTGGTSTGSGPVSIYVQGRCAYIVNELDGTLQIFDVSNQTTPSLIGKTFLFGTSSSIAPIQIFVQGRYAYVVNIGGGTGGDSLQIFDVGGAYIQQLEAGGIEVGTLQTRENMTVNNDLAVVGGATFGRGFESNGQSAVTSPYTSSGWQPALEVAGQLFVPPMAPPTFVGQVTTGHAANSYIQGRYLYQLNQAGTFQIIDVSNPSAPKVISSPSIASTGAAGSIYVQGIYAYVLATTPSTLYVFDVSNPSSPTQISSTSVSGTALRMYVQGKYVYVLSSTNLYIYDISNPQFPTLAGQNTQITATLDGIYVQESYAYITCINTNGFLEIVSIADPANPLLISGITVTGTPTSMDVYVQGRYAYVVTNNAGTGALQIFDISNPASIPAAVGTLTTVAGTSIVVQGRYAYIANTSTSTNTIVDVSTPSAPTVVNTFTATTSGNIRTVVQGRYAYASCNGAMQVFDLGGAYIQQLEAGGIEVGTLATRENMTVNNDLAVVGGATFARGFEATGPCAITASGSYAGVSPTASGWQPALEVAGQLFVPPMAPPAAVGTITTNINTARDVYVQGRYAYVASFGNNELVVFDVSNPSTPFFVSSTGTLSEPISVYVQGRYAYVALFNSANLQIFDISNPFVPTLVSTTPTVGITNYFVYVQGKYAYVINANQQKLQIFDVSNPAAPVSVSATSTTNVGPNGLYVQENYAYITYGSGSKLEIFDVSNPAAPVSMNGSSTGTGSAPYGIYVQGRYVYLVNTGSGGTTGLQIFDIANPASPLLVSNTPTGSTPFDVYVQGRYAYVVNEGSSTLQIFDVSNPAAPVSMGSVTTNANPSSLFVQGRYVYVATESNSLQIFDVGGAYIQQLEAGGIEVGTLATRENMTVNNDLAVVGGATFARGFESNGPSAITGSSFSASPIPALVVTGSAANANSTPLRLSGVPTGTTSDNLLTIDGSGNVRELAASNIILNGGQAGALTIGTNNATTLTLETNSVSGLSIDTSQNVNVTNNLLMPNSTSSVGVIKFGGNNFVSNAGTNNTFVGQGAGNTSLTTQGNVGIGTSALADLTIPSTSPIGNGGNTGVGYGAGSSINTGFNNVCIGLGAGNSLTSGYANVFLGEGAGGNNSAVAAVNSNIYIGAGCTNPSSTPESNTLRIGNGTGGSTAGNLNTVYIHGIVGATVASAATVLIDNSAGATNGHIGILTSSARYKKDIVDIAAVKELIQKMRPIKFAYKNIPDEVQYGLLAEDMEQIMPELVIYKDGQPETIRYHLFDAIFIKALQELIAQNEALEKQLTDQQQRLEKQELLQKYLMEQVAKLGARFEQA